MRRHLHPELKPASHWETKDLSYISKTFALFFWVIPPSEIHFAGSTVNVSLFFVLGFNLSNNKLGIGFSVNKTTSVNLSVLKHHALVTLLFSPCHYFHGVLTAGGERWVWCRLMCELHTCLSPLIIPLSKYEPKYLGGIRKASPQGCLPKPRLQGSPAPTRPHWLAGTGQPQATAAAHGNH